MGFPEDWQDLKDYEGYQKMMMDQGYMYVQDDKTKKMKWVKPEMQEV